MRLRKMCIRDRLVTVGFSLVGFLDDFLKVKYKNTVGLKAVSYTHLDVYKRQGQHRGPCGHREARNARSGAA